MNSLYFEKIKDFFINIDIKKIKLISSWFFGGLFLFLALIYIFSDFLAGVIIFLVACLIFPPLVEFIKKKWNFNLTDKVRNISIFIGIILFFMFSGNGETYEIKVYQGDEKDEERVLKSGQNLIDVVGDFQDAQLSTVALLSVRFEDVDKEEYLKYIDEVLEKWEKVEKGVKKIKKDGEKAKKAPQKPVAQNILINSVIAKEELPESIEFGDGFENNGDEVQLGIKEGEVYGGNPFEEAYAFRRTGLSKTANEYLQGQLKTTAEGAQEALKEYHDTIKLEAEVADDFYAAATDTAQKIAYTSKVSLYVLGSVASFGSAAAATSATGVITGYFSAAWGTAIAATDLALDVSQEISTISTGKGLTSYEKDKRTIGDISELYTVANLFQIGSTGGFKFDGKNQFVDANDFIGIYNMKDVGADMSLELDKEIWKVNVGGNFNNSGQKSLNETLKEFRNPNFSYNGVDSSSEAVKEKENAETKKITGKPAKKCQNGEKIDSEFLKYFWPACENKKDPCQGLENSCVYKDHCICEDGYYSNRIGSDGILLSCITEEERNKRLGIQLGNSFINGNGPTISKEDQEFIDKLHDPKLIKRAEKAMKCGL